MRAVVCHETRLTVRDLPDPEPGEGQLVLDVIRCGICGSDLHARHHGDDVADAAAKVGLTDLMRCRDEVVLGHEFSGQVLDYGRQTHRRWKPGTPVVALPLLRTNGTPGMTGLSPNAPGAYAERVVVQESMTMPIPSGLDPALAAMTEPMAVALHAVRKSRIGKRETAVVVGAGPIGLAVIQVLKALGVKHVIASDFSPFRRGLAVRCGADEVVDPAAESPWASFAQSKRYYTSGKEVLDLAFDTMETLRKVPHLPWAKAMRAAERIGATPRGPVVFECVGVPGMIAQIMDQAPLYSRIIVVGVCMQPDQIAPSMGTNKEIMLQFVFAYDPSEFADALHLMADGKIDPAILHTGTVGLDGVEAAFDDLASAGQHAKILINPRA